MEIFQPTIIKQAGLSTSSVAIIYFVMPLLCLLSRIAFGVIADKFHVFRAIFLMSLCASASVILIYVFLPQRIFAKATFLCSDTETMVVLPRNAIDGDAERENKNVTCEVNEKKKTNKTRTASNSKSLIEK